MVSILRSSKYGLGPEDKKIIYEHLSQQYKGVFSEAGISTHLLNHVGMSLASSRYHYLSAFSNPSLLLDIGSGYGSFVIKCREEGISSYGIEIAPFEVSMSQKRLQSFGETELEVFKEGSAYNLPYEDETFDVVTLWDVVEHIKELSWVLSEVKRVLKPNGILFLDCPNYSSFRKEAHYHVLWVPFLPRRIASWYLKKIGRNPSFFCESIFYRSNLEVLASLRKVGFVAKTPRLAKFENTSRISNLKLRAFVDVLRKLRIANLLYAALFLDMWNPLRRSISLIAIKPLRTTSSNG